MKKSRIIWFSLLFTALVLSGCSASGDSVKDKKTDGQESSAAENDADSEMQAETGDSAETDDVVGDVETDDLVDEADTLAGQAEVDKNLKAELENGYTVDQPLVVVNPYGNSPLSALLLFTTEVQTPVHMTVQGKNGKNQVEMDFDEDKTKEHIIPVYGLYAGEKNTVEIKLSDGITHTVEIETEAVDTALSQAQVTSYAEDADPDGLFTFCSINSADNGQYSAVAYDDAGDIRWFWKGSEGMPTPIKRLKNGHIATGSGRIVKTSYYQTGIIEMDLIGKIYGDYLVPGGMHHDFVELENGNFLVSSDAEDFSTMEDRIVEISRKTGEVVYDLDLKTLIGTDDGGSVNQTPADWCHNNGIDYDAESDLMLLSCRHLDAVVAIKKEAKEIAWVLGDPTDWKGIPAEKFFTPVETEGQTFSWQYAQHNAVFTGTGDILLFDNGAGRTKKSAEDKKVTGDAVYSRAVQYHLDMENRTIQQVWSYGQERGREWYSSFISGVQELSEGEYWITSGSTLYNKADDTYDVPLTQFRDKNVSYTTHIDRVKGDTLLYEMILPALTYRSVRLSLYSEKDAYSADTTGKTYGSLGVVPTIENPDVQLSDAKEIDFSLTTLTNAPDRLTAAGSWPSTGEDAALILADSTGKLYSFSIAAPSFESEGEDSFSVWITGESIPQGEKYGIYLYNNGILYSTGKTINNMINTRASSKNQGAQYTMYDVQGYSYALLSGAAVESKHITTDIKTETEGAEATLSIEQMISDEQEKNAYTFQDPLVILNPYQNAPLSAMAVFKTEKDCRVRVTVKGKAKTDDLTDTIDASSDHRVPILGLYAGEKNQVVLELLDESDRATEKKVLSIETDPLPGSLSGAVKPIQQAADSAMDWMLVTGLETPNIYAFDAAGDIRWYTTAKTEYYGVFPLANGRFLIEAEGVLFPNASMPNSPKFYEMDYMGRIYRTWFFPEGVHHEIKEKTPGGNLLVATNSNDGQEQNMIQEVDRETGEVIKTLQLAALFADTPFVDTDDWAHINTLSYDEATDTILVSARNLNAVIRIDWSTDEIRWILSDPAMWKDTVLADKVLRAEGDVQWQYEQHSAYQIDWDADQNPDTISIMLFDNHQDKHRKVEGFTATDASYVKLFSVNEKAGTVSMLHSYTGAYSKITSNFQMPEDGNRVFSINAYLDPEVNGNRGMVYEFDRETGEMLNAYALSHRFYRGYLQSVDLNSCAGVYTPEENLICGNLRKPKKQENPLSFTAARELTDELDFTVSDGILYVKGLDHTFTQLIFCGGTGTYVYDLSAIKRMRRNGEGYEYAIPVPLTELDADSYRLQVMYADALYDIPHTIQIA